MNLDDNDDWIDTPEAIELRRQMATLEEKITNFKQEIETQDNDPDDDITDNSEVEVSKWSKPIYISDPDLPKGWTHFRNREGSVFYRDANGKFLKNRRNVLTEMYSVGGFSPSEIRYIRDGLVEDGWNYHDDLPDGWMFKQYVHKIEGVNTEVLYKLSPNGIIYRSKKKIAKMAQELNLSKSDLKKIQDFKIGENKQTAGRTVEEPDESWFFDSMLVPVGWKMKRYTYKSGMTKKTEEVYHYLTPDNTIVRGKKQVHDWMLKHGCYNSSDFALFHFNKKEKHQGGNTVGRPSVMNWSVWESAQDLPDGWQVRYGTYKYQKKVQYKSPMEQIFLSKFKVLKFLKSGAQVVSPPKPSSYLSTPDELRTVWDDWREDDIPCLPSWQFSIGRKGTRRKIRYRSPNGKVFQSRGPLIRFLHENNLKGKQQLITLKKLLKTNQIKEFEDLRTNDKFIKNFAPDWNYLLFLKLRYENQEDVPEYPDRKLPFGWKKKMINGVEYFKDPTEKFVFNSRKLVVEHLRTTNYDLSDEDLVSIMEDSDSESDLSDTESEPSDDENEEESSKKQKYFTSAESQIMTESTSIDQNYYQIPESQIKTETVDSVSDMLLFGESFSDDSF